MEKKTTFAFGKKIYLLGEDENGTKYWLEKASWDCGWYWGFGYVETYTNNASPSHSRDISSHQHFDGLFLKGPQCAFDNFKKFFKKTPLSNDEIWLLVDYMMTFYKLKDMAEVFKHGNSWQTEKAKIEELVRPDQCDLINKQLLPKLFEKIETLLKEEE